MVITKTTLVDKIEVTENNSVQVRTATTIVEDGRVIGQSFQRHVIVPGADYSGEDTRVQAICSIIHTVEVIKFYKSTNQGV